MLIFEDELGRAGVARINGALSNTALIASDPGSQAISRLPDSRNIEAVNNETSKDDEAEKAARRVTVEITSAVPMTGRPSWWSPKTASEKRSCTSSCGVSSYIAISSSTTSRSWSSSAKDGTKTISVITPSARSTCLSGTRV